MVSYTEIWTVPEGVVDQVGRERREGGLGIIIASEALLYERGQSHKHVGLGKGNATEDQWYMHRPY